MHVLARNASTRCACRRIMEDPTIVDVFESQTCHTTKHLTQFSAVFCKQFLQKERRDRNFRCLECQFPKCGKCNATLDKPVFGNHLDANGQWYCHTHRYPPCSVCRITQRSGAKLNHRFRFQEWVCSGCQKDPGTATSSPKPAPSATDDHCITCTSLSALQGNSQGFNRNGA